MLALLVIPALLGLVFLFDDDDDSSDDMIETTDDGLETTTLSDTETDFEGGDADERAVGNDLDNTLSGGAGDDVLVGNGGADDLNGDAGADTVFGGSGNDTATGGAGDDEVFLGAGADEYTPGETAAEGNDAGNDTVNGGVGSDVIVDLQGSNTLTGSGGNDILSAIDGLRDDGTFGPDEELGTTDILRGGDDDDALIGDDGDEMTGGSGADAFYVAIDETRVQQSVVITDFNVSEDSLAVVRFGDTTAQEDVTFVPDATQNALGAFFNGTQIAVLEGLGEEDIAAITVAVFDQDDYDARLSA